MKKETLATVLHHHVLTSACRSDDFELVKSTGTARGKPVTFKVEGGTIQGNDAEIVKSGVAASNGVIPVTDRIPLLPK